VNVRRVTASSLGLCMPILAADVRKPGGYLLLAVGTGGGTGLTNGVDVIVQRVLNSDAALHGTNARSANLAVQAPYALIKGESLRAIPDLLGKPEVNRPVGLASACWISLSSTTRSPSSPICPVLRIEAKSSEA